MITLRIRAGERVRSALVLPVSARATLGVFADVRGHLQRRKFTTTDASSEKCQVWMLLNCMIEDKYDSKRFNQSAFNVYSLGLVLTL